MILAYQDGHANHDHWPPSRYRDESSHTSSISEARATIEKQEGQAYFYTASRKSIAPPKLYAVCLYSVLHQFLYSHLQVFDNIQLSIPRGSV